MARSSPRRIFFRPPKAFELAFALGIGLLGGGVGLEFGLATSLFGLGLGAFVGKRTAPRKIYFVRGSRRALTSWWEVLGLPLSHRRVLALLEAGDQIQEDLLESKELALSLRLKSGPSFLLEIGPREDPDRDQRRDWLRALLLKIETDSREGTDPEINLGKGPPDSDSSEK